MKTKIIVLVAGSIALLLAFIFWNQIILPMILTENHRAEMRAALVKYWNVSLDKSTVDDPSKLATVATGEALKDRLSSLPFLAATKYTDYLKSAEVVRVIEYTPTCSHIEANVEHAPGLFRFHFFFVQEAGDWKVAYVYQILPQPDFAPPDDPRKSCADFAQ